MPKIFESGTKACWSCSCRPAYMTEDKNDLHNKSMSGMDVWSCPCWLPCIPLHIYMVVVIKNTKNECSECLVRARARTRAPGDRMKNKT